MIKSIDKYISELLFLHDCVIMPEFGGFVGNKKSSILNNISNTIHPPYKEILFNKNLKTNDGLLISHIAICEGITIKDAKILLSDYVILLKNKLIKAKTFRIEKVGLLSMNRDENIVFLQDSYINYNINSFGLSNQQTNKVAKIEKDISRIISPLLKKEGSRRTWRAAAILIPIISLSLISITQESKINNIYSQMANMNPFEIFESSEKNIKTDKIILKETIKEVDLPIITEKRFLVIAGSFGIEENASNLVIKLKKENFNAEIIGVSEKGLTRVCYDKFLTRNEAQDLLKNLKADKKSAWILYLKNDI